jgi:adenylyltransferase/sulfurtransferase
VRHRIEVNSELPPLAIEGRVLNEMYAHARETWPEECCGLITGDPSMQYQEVHRCRNEMTRLHRADPAGYPRDGRRAFHMNELDYVRVRDLAQDRGQWVTAVYHSHVGSGAYFSELDQEYAEQELFPFPSADHIVIAVLERRVSEVALFRRGRGGIGFLGRAVVPGPS